MAYVPIISRAPNGQNLLFPQKKATVSPNSSGRNNINAQSDFKISRFLGTALNESADARNYLESIFGIQAVNPKGLLGYTDASVIEKLLNTLDPQYLVERGFGIISPNGTFSAYPLFKQQALTFECLIEGASSLFAVKRLRANDGVQYQGALYGIGDSMFNQDCIVTLLTLRDNDSKKLQVYICQCVETATIISIKYKTPWVLALPQQPNEDQYNLVAGLINEGFQTRFVFFNQPAFAITIEKLGPKLNTPITLSFINATGPERLAFQIKSSPLVEDFNKQFKSVRADFFDERKIKTSLTSSLHTVKGSQVIKDELVDTWDLGNNQRSIQTDYVRLLKVHTKHKESGIEDVRIEKCVDSLTNFHSDCIRAVVRFEIENGILGNTTDYTFQIEYNSQFDVIEINEASLYSKAEFLAKINKSNLKIAVDNQRLDDVRAAMLKSADNCVLLDYTRPLGWNQDQSVYTSTGFQIDSSGEFSYRAENNVPADESILTANKAVYVFKDKDDLDKTLLTTFGSMLHLHLTPIILCAIGCAITSWFRTPIFNQCQKGLILFLKGLSCSGKTLIATIANALDGLPYSFQTFASTPNAIQRTANMSTDHLSTTDDHKSELMSPDTEKQWNQILQTSYGSQGRDRFTDKQKMDMRTTFLLTGEQSLTNNSSAAGRTFEIDVPPYDRIDDGFNRKEIFKSIQPFLPKLSGLKPLIMQNSLYYYGLDNICNRIEVLREFYTGNETPHPNLERLAHSAAMLEFGAQLFFDYGLQNQAINVCEVQQAMAELRQFLIANLKKQLTGVTALSIGAKYITALKTLISSNRYNLDCNNPKGDDTRKPTLGFYDEDYVYITPEYSVSEAVKIYASDAVRMNARNVQQSLSENNLLVDKQAKLKQTKGIRQNYWWFSRDVFADILQKNNNYSRKELLIDCNNLIQRIESLPEDSRDWESIERVKRTIEDYVTAHKFDILPTSH